MKLNKIPKLFAQTLLMGGASSIVGVLSFSGMYALWPICSLALTSFGLAVAYEGEVYYQNIKQALKKLLKPEYFKRAMAKEYLRTHFPKEPSCPQFFKDYEEALQKRHQYKDSKVKISALDEQTLSPLEIQQIKDQNEKIDEAIHNMDKNLSDREKWFAVQLFSPEDPKNLSPYQKELHIWLAKNGQKEWLNRSQTHHEKFQRTAWLSILASIFMSLGSSYLLLEAFAIIPLTAALPLAILPMIIAPMALMAGAAYGFLTYNALTDMITNDTINLWYQRFQQDLNKKWQDWTLHHALMTGTSLILFSLTIAFTLCTAGTWWTIVKQTPPLFAWMAKLPQFVMGVINPVITSLTTLAFNIQNTSETLEMIERANRYAVRSLPKLPPIQEEGTHDKLFRSSYIFDETSQKLFYIKDNGLSEPVSILDLHTFKPKLDALLDGKKLQHLTPEQIHALITLNGGHAPKGTVFTRFIQSVKDVYNEWCAIENPWHRYNPFRLVLNITYPPSHKLLFLSHLTSSGVTADRVPGLPEAATAGLGFACDFAVDAHYFIPHKHEPHDHSTEALLAERLGQHGGHDHDTDFPTKLLKCVFFPLHILAVGWDWVSTKKEKRQAFSIIAIWNNLMSPEEESAPSSPHTHTPVIPSFIPYVQHAWPIEHAIYRIERFKEKHLRQVFVHQDIAKEKIAQLTTLQHELRTKKITPKVVATIKQTVTAHLKNADNAELYGKQRFFGYGKTATTAFLEQELLQRVTPQRGA